jgi:protease-4
LERAREDDSIAAVVLRIDSPGGSATASDLIYRAIVRLRERKPVVASLGNLAASGGYYVAMGADWIVAEPTSLTGSIGVYAGKLELSGLYEKLGISHEELLRGENAGAWSELHPFTEAQRADLSRRLAAFYERFVRKVALERELDFPAAEAVARGRIWSGLRASQCGLVDSLGSLPDAIARALELAGLAASARPGLESYQPEPSWLDRVLVGALRDAAQSSARPRVVDQALGLLRSAERTFDGSTQFHLPLRIRIQ